MKIHALRNTIFFIVLSLLIIGCSKHTNPQDIVDLKTHEQANALALAQFKSAEKALQQKHYADAVRQFEGLLSTYPFSPVSEQAELNLIYAYYMQEAYPLAVSACDRFIHLFPRSAHVDYAYFMRGVANLNVDRGFFVNTYARDLATRDLKNFHEAYKDFETLVKRYPASIYRDDALQRMIYCRNLFAERELVVGRYYFARHAYVGAANRASYIIKNYRQAPQAIPALDLLIAANKKLGLHQGASEAEQVLAETRQRMAPNS